MNQKHLFLACLTLPFLMSCTEPAKISGGSSYNEESELLSSETTGSQDASISSSSSKKVSSSLSSISSMELSSEVDYSVITQSSSSTFGSSASKPSSASGTPKIAGYLLFGTESVDDFNQTENRILTTPQNSFCEGEDAPRLNPPKVWIYWLQSSTLYTFTQDTSDCMLEACSEMQGTSDILYDFDDSWKGGTSVLDTWESTDGKIVHISKTNIELFIKASLLSNIMEFLGSENVIGMGSSAQLVSPTIIEVPYQGHTIRLSLEVDSSNGILHSYKAILSEDQTSCTSAVYFYQNNPPTLCPADSYTSIDICTSQFVTDAGKKDFCDLDRLNDGNCDDYCLNFDDAADCSGPVLFKKSMRQPKPLLKSLLKNLTP